MEHPDATKAAMELDEGFLLERDGMGTAEGEESN